ncbi:MAG: glutamate synthase [Oscillospiraceae bacterium]|jgi:glutamate synthase domain-containing protein 3|nr:glutamate synthase [Oscillospiraceae bacterium]
METVMSNKLCARELGFRALNDAVRGLTGEICIGDCFGERYIGASATGKTIIINGTPGNALGAYLDGADIVVNGNAQDAVGDTMNDGRIVVHGSAGDALGYGMRGGVIYVRDNSGYRTGIHMKQYMDKRPVIMVGGSAGSFLGEYIAGGLIIVLGIGAGGAPPVGRFTGTGMHGGAIFLRCDGAPDDLPEQVACAAATPEDKRRIERYVREFSEIFGLDADELLESSFFVLTPNASNPYKQLYTAN